MPNLSRVVSLAAVVVLAATGALAGPMPGFVQTNLVSDIPGLAANTDANLKNPWGISFGSTSPFWVSDNHTGVTTLYNGAGVPQGLVVTIPGAGGAMGAPTGQVFNTAIASGAFNGDAFIFAGEDGLVTGWRGALGTTAEVLADKSGAGAIYKGIALASIGSDTYLYSADFHNNKIDVLPSSGAPALSGNFTDPNLPSGYAPFNVQNIGGQLYVTYAKQDAMAEDDVPGAGFGYIDIFDVNGNFVKRLVSQGSLNAPWGLAQAPSGFGPFGGDLLVGNFGDGTINAFDSNGNMVGTVSDVHGNPLVNDGLWGLTFGNGGNGGSSNVLYFAAGINDENDGLFGAIAPVPEPGTLALFSLGGLALLGVRRRRA